MKPGNAHNNVQPAVNAPAIPKAMCDDPVGMFAAFVYEPTSTEDCKTATTQWQAPKLSHALWENKNILHPQISTCLNIIVCARCQHCAGPELNV